MNRARSDMALEETRRAKERLPRVPLAKNKSFMRSISKAAKRSGNQIPPPCVSPSVLEERESRFVNDGIISQHSRTRWNDTLIPKYESLHDVHCRSYFRRDDVQKLIGITLTLKPVSKMEKKTSKSQSRINERHNQIKHGFENGKAPEQSISDPGHPSSDRNLGKGERIHPRLHSNV